MYVLRTLRFRRSQRCARGPLPGIRSRGDLAYDGAHASLAMHGDGGSGGRPSILGDHARTSAGEERPLATLSIMATVKAKTVARGYGPAHKAERKRRLALYRPGDIC